MPTPVREPRSITHVHLAAVLNSEVDTGRGLVRVLDAGCGDGQMLEYLVSVLGDTRPDVRFEFYGFDVSDSAVQSDPAFLADARRRLVASDLV